MSFGGASGDGKDDASGSSLPGFKKFISEDELDERRKKRQEEWEKVRKPEDPTGNQIRGLENDEVEFLDFVSQKQEEVMKKREQEETGLLEEYRTAMMSQVVDHTTAATESKGKSSKPAAASQPTTGKKSQQALLAGAVKRKSQDGGTSEEKKLKTDVSAESGSTPAGHQVARVIGVLPGLGVYTDSSDSDASSSDSDIEVPPDVLQRKVVHVHHQ